MGNPLYRRDTLTTYPDISRRTTKCINSFFPDAVRKWNIIGTDFQTFTSLNKFKRHTLSLIRPNAKTVFGIHDPTGFFLFFFMDFILEEKCTWFGIKI